MNALLVVESNAPTAETRLRPGQARPLRDSALESTAGSDRRAPGLARLALALEAVE